MGITLAGSKVSAWADQSGAGNDWAQGTDAWRPVYTAANANMRNKPTLAVTSAMIGLTRANFAQGLGAITVGVFYRRSVDSGAPRVFGVVSPSGGAFNMVNNSGTGFDASVVNTGTNTRRSSPDGINVNWSRITAFPIATAATDDPVTYSQGVAGGSAPSSTAVNGTIPAASWHIGYLFDGDIAEVFAYDRIITAAEAASLYAYQLARYG
jgi:hypothetical protein